MLTSGNGSNAGRERVQKVFRECSIRDWEQEGWDSGQSRLAFPDIARRLGNIDSFGDCVLVKTEARSSLHAYLELHPLEIHSHP